MKALEFSSELGPNQTLNVPADVAALIPVGQPLRVLVLVGEDAQEKAWEELAATDFGQGYSDSDAIYDRLSAG